MYEQRKIAVVIPAYKVSEHISELIREMPDFVDRIFVVDDACPEKSGRAAEGLDSRVSVIYREQNGGVGAAAKAGLSEALDQNADIIVKLDGDGQMSPLLIEPLILPIVRDQAELSKGNRFSSAKNLEQMPKIRIFGNAMLSVSAKASTGYWGMIDFSNGFIAISGTLARDIKISKLHNRYFFESDLLFRAGTRMTTVAEIGMRARYGGEKSNLSLPRVALTFPFLHLRNTIKRIAYKYYGASWSIASFELPLGIVSIVVGTFLGVSFWQESAVSGNPSTAGQVLLTAFPLIIGTQLLLSFTNYDVSVAPQIRRYNAE